MHSVVYIELYSFKNGYPPKNNRKYNKQPISACLSESLIGRKDSMNISKTIEDTWDKGIDSIKKTYNDTQLNPFKFPEKIKIELEVKNVDYDALLSSFFKALGNVKQEDMNNVAKVGKLIESSMKKALK